MLTSSNADPPPSYLQQHPVPSSGYNNCKPSLMSEPRKPTLPPWLGLRARLFLSPISIPLISLLFVAFRLLMSSHDVTDSVSSAKSKLLSSCNAVEGTASLAASFPHFLATATNVQLAESITDTVHGAARVFDLSMTAIEKILTYIVDSYRSLFMCFMELLVRGSLAVLIEAVQLISQAITAAVQGIRAAIQDSIQGVNVVLSTAVGGINDVVGVFGQHITPPRISVPSLAALENITLPHEIQDGLVKLNATLPTLQQLKQRMDTLIETPFEQMKQEVNTTLQSFRFNHTVFPVPEMQNVSFCDRIDTGALDKLGDELRGVAKWGLIVLGLVALVVVVVGVGWEWWKCEMERRSVERTRAVWLAQHPNTDSPHAKQDGSNDVLKTENLMALVAISSHPHISSFSLSFCDRVGIRTRRAQDRLSWLLAFLTHPASLACFFTGILGLISVLLQTMLIHKITDHYASSIDTSLTHLTSDVLNLVNDHSRNASIAFSYSANTIILQVESELNGHVFRWVDTTTSTMNSTLNQFLDGITDALTTTFGGTPFNAPLQTFVQCIIGQKVRGIEKALTWIHDNAHVNFSRVPEDVLMLQDAQRDAVLRPVKEAMLGNGQDDGGGVAGHVVHKYLKHLEQEKVMFLMLIGVYGLILLIGLAVVLYATVADSRIEDNEDKDEKEWGKEEEKLRSSLQSGPDTSWWPRLRKVSGSRIGRVSPFTSRHLDPPTKVKHLVSPLRRTSVAHSSRSNRGHVTKDSISYPLQFHHTLSMKPLAPSPRCRQLTQLRQAAVSDRDTVLSIGQNDPTTAAPTSESRSSWISFLAKLANDDGTALQECRGSEVPEESAQDRFQRLFGCSPVASPTTPNFQGHLSGQPLATASKADESEKHARMNGTEKYRQTLDLMPVQDWIGSKSPVPPSTRGDQAEQSTSSTENRVAEINLTRSILNGENKPFESGHGSYAFSSVPGPQTRQQQQPQQRLDSAQTISFYAW